MNTNKGTVNHAFGTVNDAFATVSGRYFGWKRSAPSMRMTSPLR
jgi:hypothetical protein